MNAKLKDTVIANARIVLADRVIEQGWLALANGRIAEIGEGRAPAGANDAGGDLIMPGLIELHTDHLEAHYVPRPKVFWNPVAAVISYDGQLATSGITTVFDSLRVWREDGAEEVDGRAGVLAAAITTARDADLLRADHFLHLRCEIPMPSVVEEARELIDRPDVRLMSLMDHTPGQRQFRDEAEAPRLLSRQGRRQDRCRTRRIVREAFRVSEGLCRDEHARDRGAGARIQHSAREP